MVEPSSGNGTNSDSEVVSPQGYSTFKRKRLHGACDTCRRKKTKCDSAIMPQNICSNCINCKVQCTHESTRRKKRQDAPQPTSLHLQVLEDRLKTMEAYLRTVGPQRSDDLSLPPVTVPRPMSPEASTGVVFATSAASFQLHGRNALGSPAATKSFIQPAAGTIHDPTNEHDLSDPDDLAHVMLADRLKNLSLDITENRFFGRSSMFLFAQNCMEYKNLQGGNEEGSFARTKRPVFWELRDWERSYLQAETECEYTFPEPDLLESLLSLYHDNSHIFLPVLHWPTFKAEVETQLHLRNPSFAAVLLIVCAIASRFSTDPRVYLEEDNDSSAGWKYISQIPLTSSTSLVHPNLYDLQRNALAALYFQGSSMNHSAWNLAGIGLRLAQDSGLHRRHSSTASTPTKHSELRKRAFWSLVAMDRTMSSLLGRPCALYGEDIDVDYPVECDDEYWETQDPSQAFKQPPDRPSFMALFISHLRLCDIVGSMLRTLYSTKKCRIIHGLIGENWEVRIIAELDSTLAAWKEALPTHLQWNPDISNQVFFNQALFLHSAYFYARIQILRPLLRKESITSSLLTWDTFTICRDESITCSETIEASLRRGGVISQQIIMSAFAAALTLIMDLWARREFVMPEEITRYNHYIESCLTYIENGENRWHGAGRLVDMIAEFRSVRSVYVHDPLTPGPQPVSFSPVSPTSNLQQPGASANNSTYDDLSLEYASSSGTSLATPSPPMQNSSTALNLAALPTDTPFNFDFSHLQSGAGLTMLSQFGDKDEIPILADNTRSLPTNPETHSYSPNRSSGGAAAVWNQAPIAYSIEEWDNYIASLERFAGN